MLSTQGLGFDIPSGPQGKNPPNGAVIYDTLAEELPEDQEMTLEILDAAGKLVRTFSSKTPDIRHGRTRSASTFLTDSKRARKVRSRDPYLSQARSVPVRRKSVGEIRILKVASLSSSVRSSHSRCSSPQRDLSGPGSIMLGLR